MNSVVSTISRALPGGDPREVPRWGSPVVILEDQCEYLGTHGGRRWFDWPTQKLELEEVGELIDANSPAIPDGPSFKVWQANGGYMLQPLRPYVRGTYAARVAVVARGPAAPAAPAPVDALDAVSLLSGIGGSGKFRFRGPDAILARLQDKAGIELRPVGDGAELLVIIPGGTLSAARRDELMLLTPLLVPFIANGAVHCEGRHREPVPATTLALAIPSPRPWCGSPECMP